MLTLIRKLLRDLWPALVAVSLFLAAFQCLWVRITTRIIGELAPFFEHLAALGGLTPRDIQDKLFSGPGRIVRALAGGDTVLLESAMDVLSVGYVHPLMQVAFCVWAVGRGAGAIAGELDRGTMELLLAQPVARHRVVLAHLCVDFLTIPVLCLSLWGGTGLGTWLVGPIHPQEPDFQQPPRPAYLIELGPFRVRVEDPTPRALDAAPRERSEARARRLEMRPAAFGRALWLVGGLIFAVGGITMGLSAAGRSRWRVLGVAVFLMLVQFLINVVGQLWDVVEPLRPLTVFYYYQPQQVILGGSWDVTFREWHGGQPLWRVPMPVVLYGVGLTGYALALWTFTRRDLPAPL